MTATGEPEPGLAPDGRDAPTGLDCVAHVADEVAERLGRRLEIVADERDAPQPRRFARRLGGRCDLDERRPDDVERLAHGAGVADPAAVQARGVEGRDGPVEVAGEDDDVIDGGEGRGGRLRLRLGRRPVGAREPVEVGGGGEAGPAPRAKAFLLPLAGRRDVEEHVPHHGTTAAVQRDADGAPPVRIGGDAQRGERGTRGGHGGKRYRSVGCAVCLARCPTSTASTTSTSPPARCACMSRWLARRTHPRSCCCTGGRSTGTCGAT
ncbi:hypothetical protein LRS13_17220 [Svornostia abyssi]|uniref:Uncharacterized protein n=1 Tax=Svornostia abyssi TaxID=2898438 RepID=A0ABY5PCT8_9ACTN|nr:hypothetical protein LRS13_17220 [Parviterribacteraceae bacterium J379]